MKWDKFNRRLFLQGLGGFGLSIPLLPSIIGEKAFAQAMVDQKYFFFIRTENGGHDPNLFYGTPPSSIIQQLPISGSHPVRYASLETMAQANGGNVSAFFNSKFSSFFSKMNLIKGMDVPAGQSHNRLHLGAFSDNNVNLRANPISLQPTLDYAISRYRNTPVINVLESGSTIHTLSAGLSNPNDLNSSAIKLPPYRGPDQIFNEFFANEAPSQPPQGQDPKTLYQKTVIDHVLPDLNNLINSARLGSDDRSKLEAYAAHMHDTHQTLIRNSTPQMACSPPEIPSSLIGPRRASSVAQARQWYQALNTMWVAMAACNKAHVFSINIQSFDLVNPDDSPGGWHYHAHNQDNSFLGPYYTNQVEVVYLDLLQKLNNVQLPDGKTLLDKSVAIFSIENAIPHTTMSLPLVSTGSLDGAINTGTWIDYTDPSKAGTYPISIPHGYLYSQLLANWGRGCGVPSNTLNQYNRNPNDVGLANTGFGGAMIVDEHWSVLKGNQTQQLQHYGSFAQNLNDPLPIYTNGSKLA